MKLLLEIQRESRSTDLPDDDKLREWAGAALNSHHQPAELVIRIVDEDESRNLNREYRGKDRPTNVLSFPFEAPPVVKSDLLGDLVICAPVVVAEAATQKKRVEAHWAHMVVHGVLHLQGYDHQNEQDADEMESREMEILSHLGFPDPYQVERKR